MKLATGTIPRGHVWQALKLVCEYMFKGQGTQAELLAARWVPGRHGAHPPGRATRSSEQRTQTVRSAEGTVPTKHVLQEVLPTPSWYSLKPHGMHAAAEIVGA